MKKNLKRQEKNININAMKINLRMFQEGCEYCGHDYPQCNALGIHCFNKEPLNVKLTQER